MAKADFLTGLALMALSLYVIGESWFMSRMEHLGAHPLSAPGLVPGFLGVILFLLGTFLLVRSIFRGGHRLGIGGEKVLNTFRQPGNRRLLLAIALTLGYAGLAVGVLPFWLATAIFVFLFIILFEREKETPRKRFTRRIITASVIALLTAIVVTAVFERLFLVALP